MKLAFSSNAFRNYSLVETIKILAEIGYQGIEIMADVPHAYPPHLADQDMEEIRKTLQNTGMQVSNINAFMLHAIGDTWRPSWIEKEEEQRKIRIEHTRDCLELAVNCGTACLSTEPGGPLEGMAPVEGMRLFREGLEMIAQDARQKNIKILIEPEPDLLIENSRQFLDFMTGMDPEVFGLNFDMGHFYCVGEDPAVLIRELRDHIYHFHLEDIAASRKHHHLLPGSGAMDFPTIFQVIEEIDYQGFITVELYPYENQPIETARQAFRYLTELNGVTWAS